MIYEIQSLHSVVVWLGRQSFQGLLVQLINCHYLSSGFFTIIHTTLLKCSASSGRNMLYPFVDKPKHRHFSLKVSVSCI